jgi:hypothetical protein
MTVSRRQFLGASGLVALPLLGLPAHAAPAAQPFAIGELWGMPYLARGAQGAAFQRGKRRRGRMHP